MKILDIPQTGKYGLAVAMPGRYGQVRRILAIPANPATTDQLEARANFATFSKGWRGLTQPQRNAWIAAAALMQTKPSLGQSGPMTGLQLYVKVNCNLVEVGEAAVTNPPEIPSFVVIPLTGLTITHLAGVVVIKLAMSDDLELNTICRASAPLSQGVQVCRDYRDIGECPIVSAGFSVITTLYTTKFGVPAAGKKIFVRCVTTDDGYESPEVSASAIVPANTP